VKILEKIKAKNKEIRQILEKRSSASALYRLQEGI
jgi:hypothetical protein